MPKIEWLRSEWSFGYSSGDLFDDSDPLRAEEERKVGGRFSDVVAKGIAPFVRPGSRVLELGPGAGSWTKVLLKLVPEGVVHTVDFQDVTKWTDPREYDGRLVCHQVTSNEYHSLPDAYFDFFFSFGVLCHQNYADRLAILKSALPKMRRGAWSVHQYGDWKKLDAFGWDSGGPPSRFKRLPDDLIWWLRNNADTMAQTVKEAGWDLVQKDLGVLQRDGLLLCKAI